MTNEQSKLSEVLGVSQEEIMKSKDIKPAFDLAKLPVGATLVCEFTEKFPRIIQTKDIYSKQDNAVKEVPIINILATNVIMVGDEAEENTEHFNVPMGKEYALFLNAKTLAIGVAAVGDKKPSLLGVKVAIDVEEAFFKSVQKTQRCYSVREILDE